MNLQKRLAFPLALGLVLPMAALDFSALEYATSTLSPGGRLELRSEGTVGHALVDGTEWKGDPEGGAGTTWDTAALTVGWQTLTSGTNTADILRLGDGVAIEGGRLQVDTTWTADRIHVVRHWVMVPSGVTLTITQGAVVKFCEATGIRVLAGGQVNVVGAEGADVFFASIGNDTYGGDTNLRDGDCVTNGYEIVTLTGGTWSDNGYWVTPDAQLRGYPEVTFHDALAMIAEGIVRVPVTISGTRNAPFSIDWSLEGAGSAATTTSGTLAWANSDAGTKFIEIPLKPGYAPSGVASFTLRATLARSVTRANDTCSVKLVGKTLDLGNLTYATSTLSAGGRLDLRPEGTVGHALVDGTEWKGDPEGGTGATWDTAALAVGWQTLTSGTNTTDILRLGDGVAVEGGRLQADTTWTADRIHVVRHGVIVPSGVTLTITEGTVVKFCEATGIRVLAGGRVNVVGAEGADVFFASIGNDTYGGDTNLRDGDCVTNGYEIVTLTGGTWSDNGYWVTPDAAVRPYPEVELHDAIGSLGGGVVRVPVSVSGTRAAPFSIDWTLEGAETVTTMTSGTLTWTNSAEGLKFIEIPLKATAKLDGLGVFTLTATRARSVNLANESATVSVFDGSLNVGDVIENGGSDWCTGTPVDTHGLGGTRLSAAEERIAYDPRWGNAASCSLDVNGTRILSSGEAGVVPWSPSGPGLYRLTHTAWNVAYTARFAVPGPETTVVEAGRLETNAVWRTGGVYLVTGTVVVPGGVTLTIESGAIVKFMPGARLVVETGATCLARGAIFTHAYDDATGGDTLFDGAETVPVMDDYEITGTITDDETTEYRYTAPLVLSGTISSNTRWRGWKLYHVTGDLTVASGVTLTVEPGAVVKFDAGRSLTVAGGATLDAQGTRAQPIVFTSVKDDGHGGDTNGDGDKTQPQPGDWARINANGTVKMNHCRLYYCSDTGDRGAIQGGGGSVTFDNGEIAHTTYECVRMNSGTFVSHNSVFRDSSMGFGYYGGSGTYVYNGVVADCDSACRASNKHFYNTVFYNCPTFLESTGSSADHCVFYNPPGFGAQSAVQVGANGNIWGDPLFRDAENGDFRTEKGSPCVDAGDPAHAPESDFYGQPRDALPDIGIYEAVGNAMSPNDLEAVSVAAAETATVGVMLNVTWQTANVGKKGVDGSWRDVVQLVSVDGSYALDLGTALAGGALAVGATNTMTAAFTIPPEAEGTWRVRVKVNAERDVFEGVNVTNNEAVGVGTVTVGVAATTPADGFAGTVAKHAPAVTTLTLDGSTPYVGRIDAPEGTVVYVGYGFMPSESSSSARTVAGTNGAVIGIPAGVTKVYVLVTTKREKPQGFTMTFASAALAVSVASPATLPYAGTTGLTVDGANFTETCSVTLRTADGTDVAGAVVKTAYVSPTRLVATVECGKLAAGAQYGVVVTTADGTEAVSEKAVAVAKVLASAKLKATLDAPANVRRGRTVTCWIDYENVGNADLPAPIFELVSEGQVFKVDGNVYTNRVKVMGLAAEAPVGTLRPGEPQRLGVTATIRSEKVKWLLRSHHAAQEGAKTVRFSLRELYDADWVLYHGTNDNATVENLRKAIGSTWADYYANLGTWLNGVSPTTVDYTAIQSAYAQMRYQQAAGLAGSDDEVVAEGMSSLESAKAAVQSARATAGVACEHRLTAENWKRQDRNGSVWKLCPSCEKWALAVQEIPQIVAPGERVEPQYETIEPLADGKEVYVICHGHQNSVATPWVLQMGKALLSRTQGNILAVNWGKGADHVLPHVRLVPYVLEGSAAKIPETVAEAIRELEALGVDPSRTTMIGHSHGGHVAARIITESRGRGFANFARYVGLDVSTTDNLVHGFAAAVFSVDWIEEIRGRCVGERAEFYKSSWDMSLEAQSELFGKYNFALALDGDFYERGSLAPWFLDAADAIELQRHSLAWGWFTATIKSPSHYKNLGFNFMGDASWKELAQNNGVGDIKNPGPGSICGMIRGNVVEMLSQIQTAQSHPHWQYEDRVLNEEAIPHLFTLMSLNQFEIASKSFRRLYYNLARTVEYEVQCGTSDSGVLYSGTTLNVPVRNLADNYSIRYAEIEALNPYWLKFGPETTAAYLIDAQGLADRGLDVSETMSFEDFARILQSVNRGEYVKNIGSTDRFLEDGSAFVRPGQSKTGAMKLSFDNDLFGADRPLMAKDDKGGLSYRRVILMTVSGYVGIPLWPVTEGIDIYPDNNFAFKEVRAVPQDVFAVISKVASVRKQISSRVSFATTSTSISRHELSENALKPGEIVCVDANTNGTWSLPLTCVESYATAEEDEIVYNRFELLDAGNDTGAPRFQNRNVICDMSDVTVSGTLPQTTDADGNLVCEGRRYTVQLTVASTEGMEDVVTCIIDVRGTVDDSDGEDEDDSSSNEPKSCDPNEMVGPEGTGEDRFVKPGDWLTYTIYFENKADAEASAASVRVTNPLSDALDWSTFEMLEVGFGNQVDTGLANGNDVSECVLDGTNTSVRTEVELDSETGVVTWYLRIVDPNGDAEGWPLDMFAGFLPPNDPETHCGEGHLTYRVKVRDDAPHGVRIDNSASIVFDYNEPIETDPSWWNTVARTLEAGFVEPEVAVDEGGTVTVSVRGGSAERAVSVQVYLAYQTASAADLDLKNAKVDGAVPKGGLRFPLTLSWAAGEIGVKTLAIPVKADKALEDDEAFTLQLADAQEMAVGKADACTVTIRDATEKTLPASVTPPRGKPGATPAVRTVTVSRSDARGGFVSAGGRLADGSALTLAAQARPGWEFRGWASVSRGADGAAVTNGVVSTKPRWRVPVTNDAEWVAVFAHIPYVRALAGPADGGKVSGSGYCPAGKRVTLRATASGGFVFAGWYAADAPDAPVATTPTLVLDRSAKPAASSRTQTVLAGPDSSTTYLARFVGNPEVSVSVSATDGRGAEPAGKGAGRYVAGTVTGAGRYAPGKKAVLKATANRGYVFAGWREAGADGTLSRSAAYTIGAMPPDDVALVAAFVTADEDRDSVAASLGGLPLAPWVSKTETHALATNVRAGVYLEWPLAASALSETTVKVAGLPAGLRFAAKPVTSRSGTGRSAVLVTNVPANTVYGAPTAASRTVTDRRTGAVTVTPSAVKVTVTTAGRSSRTYQIDATVDPLPAWAQGTFAGVSYADADGLETNGLAAVSVTAAGKVSAKQTAAGRTASFTAPWYDRHDAAEDAYHATLTAKVGAAVVTNRIAVYPAAHAATDAVPAETALGVMRGDLLDAWQTDWRREPWKGFAAALARARPPLAYAYEVAGDQPGTVALKFGANGAVTAAGTFATGVDARGRETAAKASCSATLLPQGGDRYLVFVYFPPKGAFRGHARCLALVWDGTGFAAW